MKGRPSTNRVAAVAVAIAGLVVLGLTVTPGLGFVREPDVAGGTVTPSSDIGAAMGEPGEPASGPEPSGSLKARSQPDATSARTQRPLNVTMTGAHAGVSPGSGILWVSNAELAADMAAIRSSGSRWVRLDIDWASIEPTPGKFNWAVADRVVNAARREGLLVLGVLAYTPTWARPAGRSSHAPPSRVSDFSRFASAAVARERLAVRAWEIWNEPNLAEYWEPRPDPRAYAALLSAASKAIHATDPKAVVLTGGLAPAVTDGAQIAPTDFIARVYAAGAGKAFDVVAVHPYSYPALPSNTASARWNTFVRLPLLRNVMVAHGDASKPIWLTEFGAPTGTGTDAVTQARQAQILADGFAQARRWPWIGALFTYSLRDFGTNAADREQNFGVLTAAGAPKRAWSTLVSETAQSWGRS